MNALNSAAQQGGPNLGFLKSKMGCAGLGCGVLVLIVIIVVGWGISTYNGLVSDQENVEKAWSQVETDYQRRADLIPNLVQVVKGYAKHEKSTLEEVTRARAEATSIKIDPTNLTPEKLQEYQKAQGDVTNALGKLLAVREAYPDLKANQEFLKLQDQLEGTENRITVSRRDFNEAAKAYDTRIRRFPTSIIAGIGGFERKPYFEAAAGAEKAPTVSFD